MVIFRIEDVDDGGGPWAHLDGTPRENASLGTADNGYIYGCPSEESLRNFLFEHALELTEEFINNSVIRVYKVPDESVIFMSSHYRFPKELKEQCLIAEKSTENILDFFLK